MSWLNIFGLIFVSVIMIPNIVYAIKCRDGFENVSVHKAAVILEQTGRYACIAFMVVILPWTEYGFRSVEAFLVYIFGNTVLILAYCVIWIVCFRKNNMFRAVSLSVIPSVVFLLSGVLSNYLPLVISSAIFAPFHIYISCKNVRKDVLK